MHIAGLGPKRESVLLGESFDDVKGFELSWGDGGEG
jgi:hypothetical protein